LHNVTHDKVQRGLGASVVTILIQGGDDRDQPIVFSRRCLRHAWLHG